MHRAIWTIIYDLGDDGRDAYLRWFHDVHIPEKLARPGYNWAGHYEIGATSMRRGAVALEGQDGTGASPLAGKRYIAMFGGESTATFYNPSPLQLKGHQDEETRRMIGCRVNPAGFVFAEEWCVSGQAGQGEDRLVEDPASAPAMEFSLFDTQQSDEDIGVWCVQQRRAAFKQGAGCLAMYKLLASSGPAQHGALHGYAGLDALTSHLELLQEPSKSHNEKTGHELPLSSTAMATRIWPE